MIDEAAPAWKEKKKRLEQVHQPLFFFFHVENVPKLIGFVSKSHVLSNYSSYCCCSHLTNLFCSFFVPFLKLRFFSSNQLVRHLPVEPETKWTSVRWQQ